MTIDRRLQILIAVSTVIFAFVFALYFVHVPVHINANIRATALSFTVQEKIENFLGFVATGAFESIEVQSFGKVEVRYERLAIEDQPMTVDKGRLVVTSEEPFAASVTFPETARLNDFDLSPGASVALSVHREGKSIALDIELSGLMGTVTLTSTAAMTRLTTIASILSTTEGERTEELDSSKVAIAVPAHEVITVHPKDGVLTLRLSLAENSRLNEEDVLSISKLDFLNRRDANDNLSSIVEGQIEIRDTERSLRIGRKQPLGFAPGDTFEVRDLSIANGTIDIIFEGAPDELLVGFSQSNEMPSALEYLMKNQVLLLLINSYVLVITFFMALMKLNKGEN